MKEVKNIYCENCGGWRFEYKYKDLKICAECAYSIYTYQGLDGKKVVITKLESNNA